MNPIVNIEAEESVIGSIILDGGKFSLIDLSPSDFHTQRWGVVWSAFDRLSKQGRAIDYTTTIDELAKHHQLEKVGGVSELTKLLTSVVSSYNVLSYAAIVKENAIKRKQLDIANKIATDTHNGGVDVATVIDMLSETGGGNREGRHIGLGLSDLYDTTELRSKNPRDVWGIPTGFIDLDKRTGGLHKQQTLMISGSPGVGKTTIMLQIALNAAKQKHGVAIFEAEMDEQRVLRRLIEILYKIPNRAMLTGRMDGHWSEFTAAIDELNTLSIYINDDPGIDTGKMRGELARLRSHTKIDLVCLDYINLLKDKAGDGRSTNDNIATKARRFREICREMDLSGLTVQSMTKEGMRAIVPNLADMSGPAEVHYGADTIFFLVEDQDTANVYNLLPAKQRDGDSGASFIKLTRTGLSFADMSNKSMYPQSA